MRICFITGAFPNMKCGIGDYTNQLSNELLKLDNEISVITSKDANSNNKVKVYNIIEKWNFKNLKLIITTLKKIKPDVVHIQYPSNEYGKNIMVNLLPLIIKIKIRCKVVITIHEFSIFGIKGKLRNLINISTANKVVVVEKKYIEQISNLLKYFKKNINIVYIPIASSIPISDISEKEKNEIKESLKIKGKKIISYFGFATPQKGIEYLFEAIKQLKNENIKLLFIGELSTKNEYHNKLINMIEDYDIKDNIYITGYINSDKEVAKYLKISDVCVLPFINGVEERNSSFLAAYVQDVPIITTSLKELESRNGIYYIQPKEPSTLKEEINYVINTNEVIERKKKNWNAIATIHQELYKNM